MEFRVLGPLEVIGPRGLIHIASGRQRGILALLILNIGETVDAGRLIDEVWGDEPPTSAHHALVVFISRLRGALGPELIETYPNGYRLRAAGNVVDLERFERLAANASDAVSIGDARTGAARYAAALAQWRGPALGDLATEHAARAERTRLDELRSSVLERRIDADLACGRHQEVIPELRLLVAEMPLREALQARLMLALYRSARQADALDVYHTARKVLDRELGVEPGRELEALQRAILDHDPALDLVPALGATGSVTDVRLVGGPQHVELAPDRPPPTAPGPADAKRQRGDARRTVTALMAAVSGSTLLGAPLDPESARRPLERCYDTMRSVLERHGGTVEQVVGDAVLAVFGVPLVHEDDALRAVRAAVEMRDALASMSDRSQAGLGVRITMRAGVNTGEVIVSTRGTGSATRVTGDSLNLAIRLEQAAGPGEILVGGGTYDLVRRAVDAEPAGAIDLSGKSGSISAFRLLAITPGVGRSLHRFGSPLVGRERQRRLLEAALDHATADETCQLFTLLGPAGVGKSRLVHEFLASVRPDAQVVRGRCLPYGEGSLWPVVEAIRQVASIGDADTADESRGKIAALLGQNPSTPSIADRVAAVIGASDVPSTAEETFRAIRSVFEGVARRHPVVMVFDDAQWGEPTFLDLIEYLAGTVRGAPILLLCIARPELLDERPGWGGGQLNSTSVLLEPLTEPEVSRLVENLLGGSRPSQALERKIAEAAEGNPLFVEEFLAMLQDDGVIRQTGDEWVPTADLATIATPASITALLAARLDRLPDHEREAMERAAVIGKVFTREAVEALVEESDAPDVGRRLGALVRREILRPDRSSRDRPDTFRFRHILIRDVAYGGLPKADRAELHEQFAHFQARTAGDRLIEYEEILGYHFEQAAQIRQQLGLDDERTRDLAGRAAQFLGAAGIRAIQRGDGVTSNRLLERCRAVYRRPLVDTSMESSPRQ